MKLLTRDTDYAIQAIACIDCEKDKVITVKKMAQRLDMPRPFLRKLLQILNREGILASQKGKGGGFVLAIPLSNIKLTTIMQIFQGPFILNEHVFKKTTCPRVSLCPLKKRIDLLESKLYSDLGKINLGILRKLHIHLERK